MLPAVDMRLRAFIFDVYGTLLEVGSAPADADRRWQTLWREMLGAEPPLSRLELSVTCSRIISRQHQMARSRGITHPEINWCSVLAEALHEFNHLPEDKQHEFIRRHIETGHTTRLVPSAVPLLKRLKQQGCLLGIASNAQEYTLRELSDKLAGQGQAMSCFESDLCFWSFEHGFSKPDPHVFQILSARLELHGISAPETMMVGDRFDNDIEPAQKYGWRTWQLASAGEPGDGTLAELAADLPR
jgi:FMN phosphatase YigB (HAD superfamily)